jgi:hypothetical protein
LVNGLLIGGVGSTMSILNRPFVEWNPPKLFALVVLASIYYPGDGIVAKNKYQTSSGHHIYSVAE